MQAKWGTGANYDRSLLKIYTSESGFILGVSKLGDKLGVDGADVEIPAEFTSININMPCSSDGLFVYKEVATCSLTATMPEYIDLMKKRLSITYDGEILFKGTVQDVSWTESVDDRYWLPGNTPGKSYDVSLLVTAGDEAFSDAVTPPKNFSTTQVEGRVGEWLGLTVDASLQDPGTGLGVELYDNVMRFISDYVVINASDDLGSLADTLRNALKLTNMHYVYEPWNSTVRVINNNRWHAGNDETDSLVFTDDPADNTVTSGYLHGGRFVMYSSREFGFEPGLYQGSVRIQTNFGGEEVFGPYRASEVNPSDVLVDLGKQSVDGGDSLPRNYVSTLPLKRSSEAFTKSITMPLQSYYQIYTDFIRVPGMALLKNNGVTEKVAVLGVTHNITPHLWTVTYTLGPHHLLDRQGDFDPSLPRGLTFIDDGAGTGTVRFNYFTPETRPTDVNLWAYVYTNPSPNKNDISWTSSIVVRLKTSIDSYGSEQVMPTSVTYFSTARPTTPGTYFYYLAITSDPNPGSGVVNHQYRQSQPVLIGTVVVT
jgi:hypothetical protein